MGSLFCGEEQFNFLQNIQCISVIIFLRQKRKKIYHLPQKYDLCLPQQTMASSRKSYLM